MRLVVERACHGPNMIAHDDRGKTVFVANGVPGDVVEAEVVETGKTFDRARVASVLKPSPHRVQPACPYAGACGGCPWMSLAPSAQAEAKRANVVDALVRIGQMDHDAAEGLVRPLITPSEPLGYRNKVELAASDEGGRVALGMHRPGSHGVVKVDGCLLLDKRFAKLPKAVAGALGYLASSNRLGLERVGIRASSRTRSVEVSLWGKPGAFPRAHVAKVLGEATKATSVVRVLQKGPAKARKVAGVERLAGAGCWAERVSGATMRLSAPSFFQVNTQGADELVRLVLEALKPQPHEEAMDLYCGAGTFTLPLAAACSFVSAVESYGPAVRDLRRNLEEQGRDNVDPIGGDAGREFPDDASVIVVDPPRAGLGDEVVRLLSGTSARAIAYVSCDPATLARDLRSFATHGAFEPKSVQPVDLFPHTFHVETVTLMARRG